MKIISCYMGISRPNLLLGHFELPVITFCEPKLISIATNNGSRFIQLRCSATDRTLSTASVDLSSSETNIGNKEYSRQHKMSPSLYTHPSLAQMRAERTENRARVYDFLMSIGIIPDELDGLELPVTVEVMRERVDFLHTLGLTIEDINNYPLVLGCSVKKNMVPVLDYLGKLGVRKSTLTQFLRRYPQVLHSSVVVDLAPVVKYLQGMDIKPNDIPRVLERYPEVLGFKLEGTMSTSVAYLVGIGVARREIGGVLTRYPEILGMRVGRTIKPFVDYLQSLGIPQLAIARLIESRPHILGFGLEERVKSNVKSLLEFNVRETMLASVIAQYPEIIGIDLNPKLASQREFLHSVIDLDLVSFGRVVEKMPQIISLNSAAIVKRVEFLKECQFSLAQMREMVVGCPQLLALNLDIMRRSFDFFQDHMGRPLDDLVSFPAFFTYGLVSTVRPRHAMVAKKGLKCSLAWLLNCSDVKFEERMSYDTIALDEMEAGDSSSSFNMNALLDNTRNNDDEESEYSDYEDDTDN
ncbi:OLC1v1000891C1 [Oldenlandia corymbosa var. corymbosa]|uniref:Transcription termination factor MTERF4, chloroplastic n=1 Tax=Oldenlandia corymbosa var. corymbosa TaxID=529605 RepID=A0AAV1D6S3_OLDCO|nr:OLC1v1000891C1 [Oldenlandia corymbosa var. corymbosa]